MSVFGTANPISLCTLVLVLRDSQSGWHPFEVSTCIEARGKLAPWATSRPKCPNVGCVFHSFPSPRGKQELRISSQLCCSVSIRRGSDKLMLRVSKFYLFINLFFGGL